MNWKKFGRQTALGLLCSLIALAIFDKHNERFAFILSALVVDGWVFDICEAIKESSK